MDQPPTITQLYTMNADAITIKQPKPVLTITAGGQVMRGEAPLESLTKEQLIVIVNELIALVRKK